MTAPYSIKRAMQRQPRQTTDGTPPAVMRAPMSSGEFYASWPQLATVAELQAMKGMFSAVVDGWIVAADLREEQEAAADLEYFSWFEGGRS